MLPEGASDTKHHAAWLDGLSDAVLILDARGALLQANAAALRLLPLDGRPVAPDQWPIAYGFLSEDGRSPLSPDDLPVLRALAGQAVESPPALLRNPQVPEGRLVRLLAGPWLGADGAIRGCVVLLRDETDRHREVEALRTSHLFLESIVENVPAMIFVKEAGELRFQRFNRAGEELLGLSRDVLVGKNDYDFFPPDQADHFQRLDRETLAGRAVVDIPEEPIRTAGGERWLHTKKIPVLDDEGNPRYLLGISLDITDRKRAEDDLKRANDLLEQRVRERTADLERANADLHREVGERLKAEAALRQSQKMEAIGRLAAGVAHDFNNMLTAILAYSRMVADDLPPDDHRRPDLEQIVLAAERAAGLTRQLLAFGRQQVLQPTVLDLGAVVAGTEDMLRRLLGEDVDLAVDRADDLGPVLADPGQITQVLINLAVNARDAMPGGGRLVIQTCNVTLPEELPGQVPVLPPGPYVRLSVIDNGTGMPPEVMARLFEPFFTTKPHGQGTGLGLATSFGIIRQSGGDLVASSEPGRGSTFRVYLPRCGAPRAGEAEAPGTRSTPLPREVQGATVLLVEDEPLVRRTVLSMLTTLGFRVLAAADADEARRLFASRRNDVDLLLTDVVMPGLSGPDLALSLRRDRPGLRVIFMSGHTDLPLSQAPGTLFLQKPFTPAALADRIRDVLALR